MNTAQDSGPEQGGDDIVAAEYVLGVLPADERSAVAQRVEREPAFARLVDAWEQRLSPLSSAYEPVDPPAAVKAALDRRLFSQATSSSLATGPATAASSGLWASLAFWRGLAAVSIAALALYAAVPVLNPPLEVPQSRLVASLAADGSDVRYLVVYDSAQGDVGLSHVSGERASGHDFELWMIEGKNPPVSMGVIPVGSAAHIAVNEAARAKLASGAVLAVSLEPTGGSPTGQPTGPVVAAGDLKSI